MLSQGQNHGHHGGAKNQPESPLPQPINDVLCFSKINLIQCTSDFVFHVLDKKEESRSSVTFSGITVLCIWRVRLAVQHLSPHGSTRCIPATSFLTGGSTTLSLCSYQRNKGFVSSAPVPPVNYSRLWAVFLDHKRAVSVQLFLFCIQLQDKKTHLTPILLCNFLVLNRL